MLFAQGSILSLLHLLPILTASLWGAASFALLISPPISVTAVYQSLS